MDNPHTPATSDAQQVRLVEHLCPYRSGVFLQAQQIVIELATIPSQAAQPWGPHSRHGQ
jgi:hypothetical protein